MRYVQLPADLPVTTVVVSGQIFEILIDVLLPSELTDTELVESDYNYNYCTQPDDARAYG